MIPVRTIAAGVLMIAGTCGVASAQTAQVTNIAAGRLFVYHGAASGGCPALDWHIVVGANNSLSGMIAWNNMQSMAHATGSIDANQNVNMTATEVGGKGGTATITGKLRPDGWIFADIKGPNVDCKGVAISYFTPPPGGSGG